MMSSLLLLEATGVVVGGRSSKPNSQLPITRVKNIIKSDPDITLASQEATLVISKVLLVHVHFIFS